MSGPASTAGAGSSRSAGGGGGRVCGKGQGGPGRGGRGGGHGPQQTGDKEAEQIDALGRCLTMILRHKASQYGLEMRADGYVALEALLRLTLKTRANRALTTHSVEDVLKAVARDNKQRFGVQEESGVLWIRANQGHSIQAVESEQLLTPIVSADEVPVCVHGTFMRHLEPIMAQGLSRMGRKHIHFATGLPTDGVISGMKFKSEVMVFLDLKRAMEDGIKFFISENKVVLSEGIAGGFIPSRYFSKVVRWPSLEALWQST